MRNLNLQGIGAAIMQKPLRAVSQKNPKLVRTGSAGSRQKQTTKPETNVEQILITAQAMEKNSLKNIE